MLPDQTCTNLTGFLQRQRSTPTLPTLNQPILLSRTPPDEPQSKSHGLGREDHVKSKTEEEHHGMQKENQGQQDERQDMQETQQPCARPGRDHNQQPRQELGTFQSPKPLQYPSDDHDCLSAEDINALLVDLQSRGPWSAQELTDMTMTTTHPQNLPGSAHSAEQDINQTRQHSSGHQGQMKIEQDPLALSIVTSQSSCENGDIWESLRESKHPDIHHQESKTTSIAPVGFDRESRYTSRNGDAALSVRRDPNLTIKASQAMQRGRSHQESWSTARHSGMGSEPLSPPNTAPLTRRSVDCAVMPSPGFPNLADLNMDMPTHDGGYNPAIYSPIANAVTSSMNSFQSSPEMPSVSLFESTEVDNVVLEAQISFMQATQGSTVFSGQPPPVHRSPHQRAQSMGDIDVEECIQDTGVTAEEIASFIQGPFPEDQKWSCLYEEIPGKICGKRFARKENARSHVQTHLGDRQYVCKVCQTPFVRQHDLKRHFKIHATEKPHRCPCGKDFHRQDALTRHRQRGMCVGAIEGSPKKSVKRGRPKKPRPTNEERIDKAAKTRQYVMERTKPGSTYASSISGSSEYSVPSPPSFDNDSVTASSPSFSQKRFQSFKFPARFSEPPTPPTSPERRPDSICSSPFMHQSYMPRVATKSPSPKLTSITDQISSDRALSGHEYYRSSPPDLAMSSSSPATSHILDYSEASGPHGKGDQILDCLNPSILNGDFQLFDDHAKETLGSIKFEDFIDFGNVDTACAGRPGQKVHTYSSGIKLESFSGTSISHLDDPFVDL